MNSSKTSQLILAPKEASRLFRMSSDLADAMEDILESGGAYSQEFVKGLKQSFKQAKAGRAKKINSLRQLK